MALFDLPLEELQRYRYPRKAPADLREFWTSTIEQSRSKAAPLVVEKADTRVSAFEISDLTFSGFGGEPIKAWALRPARVTEELPVIVEYVGYGGGRGRPHERMVWAAHGYLHVVVDTRGQGSVFNVSATPDPHGSAPATPGYLTRGIDDKDNLYYRRVFTDAVLAVDAVRQLPGIDQERIAVWGHSQGGAMAMATAALRDDLVACGARTPFLCGIDRNIDVTTVPPYSELATYLSVHRDPAALDVLAYNDVALLAPWIDCPTYVSVALADQVCPPSGIYGAINAMPTAPTVQVWKYNGHESGGAFDDELVAAFFAEHLTTTEE